MIEAALHGHRIDHRVYRGCTGVIALILVLAAEMESRAETGLVIVQPQEPAPLVARAGQELDKYLSHLFDTEVSIIDGPDQPPKDAKVAVVVGSVKALSSADLSDDLSSIAAEGYVVETGQWKGLPAHLICGKDAKGTLNGAYGFVELLYNRLLDYESADIDFDIPRGSAKLDALAELRLREESAPFYPWRGVYMHNLELGVADLLKLPEGLADSADIWKKWVDWISRHRGNYIVTWPYNSGFNWWEYINPDSGPLTGLTPYTRTQLAAAIVIRKELIKYAHERGVRVFFGNYVPGGAHGVAREVMTARGLCGTGPLEFSMCLSKAGTFGLYSAVVREVYATYPEIAGLHYRWWAESGGCFCEECEAERRRTKKTWPKMMEFLRVLVDAANEAEPDKTIIISGYRRASGDLDYAHSMPANVVFECKWGWGGPQGSSFFTAGSDWEPTAYHGVPEDWISSLDRPLLIDHRLTTEGSLPVGVDQSWQLATAIADTAAKADALPAVQGFPLVVNERDQEWVVGVQFHTLFRLNWDPTANVDRLVRDHFKNHYCPAGAENLTEALRLDGAGWSYFITEMFWINGYAFRGFTFSIHRFWSTPPRLRDRALKDFQRLEGEAKTALELFDRAYREAPPGSHKRLWDFRHQLAARYHYYAGRVAMLGALDQHRAGNRSHFKRLLNEVLQHDREFIVQLDEKPNPTFGNEFDANLVLADQARDEAIHEIRTIERILAGEATLDPPTVLPVGQRLRATISPQQIEYKGKTCYPLEATPNRDRLSFRVRSEHARFVDRDFKLQIEYYDHGAVGDVIRIEYDSHIGGARADLGNPHTPVQFNKKGETGWQIASVTLKRCRFIGAQPRGSDITIRPGNDQGEYIAAVRLLETSE